MFNLLRGERRDASAGHEKVSTHADSAVIAQIASGLLEPTITA